MDASKVTGSLRAVISTSVGRDTYTTHFHFDLLHSSGLFFFLFWLLLRNWTLADLKPVGVWPWVLPAGKHRQLGSASPRLISFCRHGLRTISGCSVIFVFPLKRGEQKQNKKTTRSYTPVPAGNDGTLSSCSWYHHRSLKWWSWWVLFFFIATRPSTSLPKQARVTVSEKMEQIEFCLHSPRLISTSFGKQKRSRER